MQKKTWDLYAPIYRKIMHADAKTYQWMYDRIPQVIRDKNVLELATGPGLLAKNISFAARRIIATDYSVGMIHEAEKGFCPLNVKFEAADAENLPYADQSFDAVIIANALHVMPHPEKALAEIHRVMKKDGILIAPNIVGHDQAAASRLFSHFLKLAGISFEHQWSPEEYKEFLEKNGWKVAYEKLLHARIPEYYVECSRADGEG